MVQFLNDLLCSYEMGLVWFLNGHSKTGPFSLDFNWLKQDGSQKWSGIRMVGSGIN
jgi:hypothetical protein